ncbi:isoflavone 3'-hydroxylase-like [Dorcoceras hygrometricum]|uniref:Isoflavone 3'-hydroxylase-like n=1 Tax=Dorcoceras hygrometricum TaxID=472368 RepID=A0A2Z7AGW2_9LAMI|nr:isoflavone 3'-hydroxylase-like [Dorcoceras hygrometricum]
MVKRPATSPHDPLGITDSACKNQSVVVSVQYGPFNPYIPIRSTTIGKSRVARDPIVMHTSWRSNSDIASVTRSIIELEEQRFSSNDSAATIQQRRKLSSDANSAATQTQQQRKFSRGDFIFSTIQVPLREARFFVQKASPWKFEKIPHAYKTLDFLTSAPINTRGRPQNSSHHFEIHSQKSNISSRQSAAEILADS